MLVWWGAVWCGGVAGRLDLLELQEEHIGSPGRHVVPGLPGRVQSGLKHQWMNDS